MDHSLAEREDGGAGGVSTCDRCDAVHLRWDGVNVSLKRERFLELARVLKQAAERLGEGRWTH